MSSQYSLRQLKLRQRRFKSYFAPDQQKVETYDPYKDPSLQNQIKHGDCGTYFMTKGLIKKKKKKYKNKHHSLSKQISMSKKSISRISPSIIATRLPSINLSQHVSLPLKNKDRASILKKKSQRSIKKKETRNFSQLSIKYTT